MMTNTMARPDVRRAFMWGGLLAALWVIVALIRPTSTFHLAPLLVAGAPVVLLGLDDSSRPDHTVVIGLGAVSLALAILAAIAVDAFGAMQGPAFEGFPTPLVEAVVFIVAGSLGSVGFALLRTR